MYKITMQQFLHLRLNLSLGRLSLPLFRRLGLDNQGMETVRKLLLEGIVDQSMTSDGPLHASEQAP